MPAWCIVSGPRPAAFRRSNRPRKSCCRAWEPRTSRSTCRSSPGRCFGWGPAAVRNWRIPCIPPVSISMNARSSGRGPGRPDSARRCARSAAKRGWWRCCGRKQRVPSVIEAAAGFALVLPMSRQPIQSIPFRLGNTLMRSIAMVSILPFYLAGQPQTPNQDLEVRDKYRDEVFYRVPLADDAAIDRAIAVAEAAAPAMRRMPADARQAVLQHCVDRFRERFDELAEALCLEAGKPIRDARGEVTRLIDTFRIAAEESVRLGGEVMNLEVSPRARGYRGMYQRVPIGPCSFISPFNFPLNLAAHKIAPAIAAGCPFVLKPASRTPVGAILIGQVLAETELPAGAFSILPCRREAADRFTTDERLKFLSFT